ncbi:MAG: 4'-phosphopantetheinyl transferase superfamily protein [Bacteroidaceae bacterium]|nr:4'-phosphopantetheinyl transferase superfamily protein [Bacteroidaceae bacterium]
MPYYQSFIKSSIAVHLWKLEEDVPTLAALLGDGEFCAQLREQCKSQSRQRERMAERLLLQTAMGKGIRLEHYPNGAPYVADEPVRISLSHTRGWVAAAISPDDGVGVDVEICSDRINKVSSHFLTSEEHRELAHVNEADLICKKTVLWCAKETMFKMLGSGVVNEMKKCQVAPFSLSQEGMLHASYHCMGHAYPFSIHYIRMDDAVLTFGRLRPSYQL